MGRRLAGGAVVVGVVLGLTPGAPATSAAPHLPTRQVAHSVGVLGAADEDGMRLETSSTYHVEPAAGVVRATIDVTVTNETPDEVTSTYISQAYFPRLGILTLAEAGNFVATKDDGTPLGVEIEPLEVPQVVIAAVDLVPDLYYQDTQKLRVSYDLPNQAPRSERLTRVNAGFAAVVPLPFGDTGLSKVEVTVPERFDVTVEGTTHGMVTDERGDRKVVTESAIEAPDTWDAVVVARDLKHLRRQKLQASGIDIDVLAWPEDKQWSDFVTKQLKRGLKAIGELVKLPPPEDDRLRVVETIAPYIYGYAGWYDVIAGTIEIGDELDARTVLHEVTHLWFNDDLFTQRWINEAFAEEYATRALKRMGEPLANPGPIVPGPGAVRLNDWSDPALFDEQTEEQEAYGYNASWAVLRSISDEIGMKRLAKVLETAAGKRIAYQGDPDPERWSTRADWRRLLDLLQEVGGSKRAKDLFAQHVTVGDESALLAERAEARQAYAGLRAKGKKWTPPHAVRKAMGDWDFGRAKRLMATSRKVLDLRSQLAKALGRLDASPPVALERAYETGKDDLRDLEETAATYLRTGRRIAEADRASDEGDGLWGSIGLLGSDPGDDVREAVSRFTEGEVRDADEAAGRAISAVADAPEEGKRRVSGVVAAAALAGVILLAKRTVPVLPGGVPLPRRKRDG
jgi:hypothetical protein